MPFFSMASLNTIEYYHKKLMLFISKWDISSGKKIYTRICFWILK